jgi:hypothetical protein
MKNKSGSGCCGGREIAKADDQAATTTKLNVAAL